jgi:uncharacterized protein (DUF1778 family)
MSRLRTMPREVDLRRIPMLTKAAHEPRTRRPKAEDRIDARLPTETKQIIERAAFISGVTLSDFVVSKAYEAAQTLVREHEGWVLNRRQSKAFVEALINPPEPNEALKAAAVRYRARIKADVAS